MIGRILLAIGYLSTPFAGPGSAVLTSAGWLTYGAEVKRPTYAWIGLVGLLGVAGVLAGRYAGLGGIEGLAGVVLLLYYVLSIVALWIVGVRSNNLPLKAAAVVLAVAWLLAATGAQASAAQPSAAPVSDWGGIAWASQAAHNVIQSIGGTQALSKVLTAAGAVLAAIGFLGAVENRGEGREETIFSMGVHF